MVCIQWFFIKCWSNFPFLILIGSCFRFFPAHVIIEQAIAFFFQCAKERWKKKGGVLLFHVESWDKSLSKLRNKIWRFHPTGYFPVLWFDNMVGKKKVVSFFIFSYFPTKIIIKKKGCYEYHISYQLFPNFNKLPFISWFIHKISEICLQRYQLSIITSINE